MAGSTFEECRDRSQQSGIERTDKAMRGIRLSSVLTFIGVIYAIGFIIHYWLVFAVILVALVVWDTRKRNSHPARPASRPQAHCSNRR